jgi:4'-phosphopantetheinyl transferase
MENQLKSDPAFPELPETHVWIARLSGAAGLGTLESTLSCSERSRAERFRFEKDRIKYIFSQGVLRQVLGGYLRTSPERIEFKSNEFGKPFLDERVGNRELLFNMSNSEDVVVVAVTTGRAVGVDVEHLRPIDEINSMASYYFSANELALLSAAPCHQREHVFYVCWTRKEAYIKAVGKGLSIPLNSFDTSMPLGAKGRPLPQTQDLPHVNRWWLSDITVPNEYVGALVTDGDVPDVLYMSFGF